MLGLSLPCRGLIILRPPFFHSPYFSPTPPPQLNLSSCTGEVSLSQLTFTTTTSFFLGTVRVAEGEGCFPFPALAPLLLLEQTGQCVGFTVCSQILRHSLLKMWNLDALLLDVGWTYSSFLRNRTWREWPRTASNRKMKRHWSICPVSLDLSIRGRSSLWRNSRLHKPPAPGNAPPCKRTLQPIQQEDGNLTFLTEY